MEDKDLFKLHVNIVVADGPVLEWAKPSAAMVILKYSYFSARRIRV